jgi:antitoxin HicB
MEKTVEYYLSLPYTIELIVEPTGGWFVAVKELPGCMSEGDTPEEAVEMIRDAMRGWIEISLEDGNPIPEPRGLEDYSGKFVVRVPRSLHRELVERAAQEGVSLNQYVNVALAQAVGRSRPAVPGTGRAASHPAPGHPPRLPQSRRAAVLHEASAPYSDQAGETELEDSPSAS